MGEGAGVSSYLAYSQTIALQGLNGVVVDVETHLGPGLIGITLVGLPDASVREAKDRVRAALASCSIPAVNRKTTINLSPAAVPKIGSSFDLAIAVSLLQAEGYLAQVASQDTIFAAELGLDGSLRPCRGILPIATAAKEHGFKRIVVAPSAQAEANLAKLEVVPCASLQLLLETFKDGDNPVAKWAQIAAQSQVEEEEAQSELFAMPSPASAETDLAEVRGQSRAVQALLLAGAGGHHVLFHGEPGCGKSMLASRLGGILPELDDRQALKLAMVRSLAEHLDHQVELDHRAPVEIVHPHVTMSALLGGGNPLRPGAISLADHGVLVLDEAPEFSAHCLDSLRQPLDQGRVTLHRQAQRATFPAQFQLILTANPCACGARSQVELQVAKTCKCTPANRIRYQSRLTGSLLDRIDIQVEMRQPTKRALQEPVIDTQTAREQVGEARKRALSRWNHFQGVPSLNARVSGTVLRQFGHLPEGFTQALTSAIERGALTMRGADIILRLAWTNADLAGRAAPNDEDIYLATSMRENLYGNR